MKQRSVGAVILAGGGSRRMGTDKALLQLEGKTFLTRLGEQLADYPERLLSLDHAGRYTLPGFTEVVDTQENCGALGGLCAALAACRSGALLTVSCDLPLFPKGLGDYLASHLSTEYDACIAVSRAGQDYPLCGVYTKAAGEVLSRQLAENNRRMMQALAALRVKRVSLAHSAYPDEVLSNVNTPEEYRALRRRVEGPPIVAVSGIKNSGKTTMLEGLVPRLRARGLRVSVIKHDGHDFTPDVPGTDSYRLREAGACGVAVYSAHRYMVTAEWPDQNVDSLLARFRDMDLILLEGGKRSAYPKVEVVRRAVSDRTVCDASTLLAIGTDAGLTLKDKPVYHINDYDGITDAILQYLQGGD